MYFLTNLYFNTNMIVVIAPYQKLKETADVLGPSYDMPIKTVIGDLSEGLFLAKQAMEEDAILVSRGGTAKLIRDILGANVIEIGVSQYDLLKILKPFIGSKSKIVISGFKALTAQAEKLCTLLGIDAVYLPIDSEDEMPKRILEAENLDIACFIGDMVAIKSAGNLGVPLALLESGVDSVREALDKAILVARDTVFRSKSERQLKAVVNTVREGIIAVDRLGTITLLNKTARELLGRDLQEKNDVKFFIPGSELSKAMEEQHESSGKLISIGEHRLAVDITPLVTKKTVEGAVLVFQEIGKIQDTEKKLRSQLHARGLFAKYHFEDIVAHSESMKFCLKVGRQYAKSKGTVLIYGETGTGKELLAQSIHNASSVKNGPFVAINCGALPPTLLESELFGYTAGAFTGAGKEGKAGLFELAHGGTIFLDEINELDIQLQGKLLRVLQEHEVMRIGGVSIIPVSFRLIAASNIPLRKELEQGRIRRDLYYRLNVLDIKIPPLRERKDDILPLFINFTNACSRINGETITVEFSPLLCQRLENYDWPGNVRELENVAEKWVVLQKLVDPGIVDSLIIDSLVNDAVKNGTDATDTVAILETDSFNIPFSFSGSLDEIVARAISIVFEQEERNISRAARRLGIDRQTLRKYLKEARG